MWKSSLSCRSAPRSLLCDFAPSFLQLNCNLHPVFNCLQINYFVNKCRLSLERDGSEKERLLYIERKVGLFYCGIHCKNIIFTENERNQRCEDKLSCLPGVKKCKLCILCIAVGKLRWEVFI